MDDPDFDDALNRAFNSSTTESRPAVPKPGPSPQSDPNKKRKERDEDENTQKKRGRPTKDKVSPGQPLPPPGQVSKNLLDVTAPVTDQEKEEAKKELLAQITKYLDTFPEETSNIKVDPMMTLDELKYALALIQKKVNSKHELQFMQSGLITTCMILEQGANFIPNKPIKLNGFSNAVSASIDSFDSVLKQMACKYGSSFSISPEMALMFGLARIAAQVHMTNTFMGGMSQPHQEDPDVAV
jgi:hypothetical protein